MHHAGKRSALAMEKPCEVTIKTGERGQIENEMAYNLLNSISEFVYSKKILNDS